MNEIGAPDPDRTREASTWTDTPASTEFPGTPRFVVRGCRGSGSFGTVYECYDRDERKAVAVKVLRRSDPQFIRRFKTEFRKLVDIRHPNLVELYELFSEGQFWFFSMELVRGVDLLSYIEHRPRRDEATSAVACNLYRLRAAGVQLAEGIAALHDAGILHCDVKPANVLVSSDGRARLLDFGLVRNVTANEVQTTVVGTPAYMSPEQARGDPLNPASDWYSFGVVLFYALTGSYPGQRHPPTASNAPSTRPSALTPGVPEDLDLLCEDLLEVDPARRPGGWQVVERLGGSVGTARMAHVPEMAEETLVGRDWHLGVLAHLLEAAEQGQTVVVNVHGPSGIGKSALVRAFCERVRREKRDAVVLSGRCHESETVPFKALDELVDELCRYLKRVPQVDAEALAPRDAQYLVRVFPVLGEIAAMTRHRRTVVETLHAQELRERAFASLQDLLARLSDRTTVVLTIDDLQWGDLDSAAFLVRLLTALSPPRVLLIASYRSEDIHTSPFLQTWHSKLEGARAVEVHDLPLRELSPSESRALADRLLARSAVTERQAQLIAEESGGIPFLIDQLTQYAARDEAVQELPVSLREATERRIADLPGEAHALLEIIALAGQPISRGVASVAAGVAAHTHTSLARLMTERLVRIRETTDSKELEVYHDRIRETIIASIPGEVRRDRHLMLARAWEHEEGVDPAVLAMHFKEGEDPEAAARWSLAAAERAAHALAFDRAAHFFQLTLQYGRWDRPDVTALQRKLASALVYAGRGVQAARVYLDAAREAEASEAIELKRLAAEQLLRSGHTEEGLDLLKGIAADLGIWYAKRPWQAAVSLWWHGLRVAMRGLNIRQEVRKEVRQRDLTVLDVYWSLGIGIGLVDVIRGWDFQARHLLLALRVGDRERAAMSMAANAAAMCGSPWKDSRLSRTLLSKAREVSDTTDQPHVLALVVTMETASALMRGDWPETARLSERANQILNERCTGVFWERSFNASLGRVAAILLGDWRTLVDHAARVPELVQEAKARGDFHTLHYLLNGAYIGSLAADRPDTSIALFREIFACLPRHGFYVPNFMGMLSEADTALYEGRIDDAWAVVDAAWPALSESLLLRLEHLFMLAMHLRARVAVAAAVASKEHKSEYLRDAGRSARRIARKHTQWGNGLAPLIEASIASAEGDRAAALELLERAQSRLEAVRQSHLVAGCRYRRGQLLGGAEGQALLASAHEWAARAGVVNLAKTVDVFVPGRWDLPRPSN